MEPPLWAAAMLCNFVKLETLLEAQRLEWCKTALTYFGGQSIVLRTKHLGAHFDARACVVSHACTGHQDESYIEPAVGR